MFKGRSTFNKLNQITVKELELAEETVGDIDRPEPLIRFFLRSHLPEDRHRIDLPPDSADRLGMIQIQNSRLRSFVLSQRGVVQVGVVRYRKTEGNWTKKK